MYKTSTSKLWFVGIVMPNICFEEAAFLKYCVNSFLFVVVEIKCVNFESATYFFLGLCIVNSGEKKMGIFLYVMFFLQFPCQSSWNQVRRHALV